MELIEGYSGNYEDGVYLDQYLFYVDSEEDNLASKLEDKQAEDLKVCRICLVSDCKLFSLDKYGLCPAYELLTGVKIGDDDGLPRELCTECVTLLDKYQQFKVKSQVAEALFMHFLETDGTLSNIKEVDRYAHGLTSNLTENHYEPNSYTYTISDFTISELQNTNVSENDYSEIEYLESPRSDNDDKEDKPLTLEIIDDYTAEVVMQSGEKVDEFSDEEIEIDWNVDEELIEYYDVKKLTVDEQLTEMKKRQESTGYINSKHKCETCFKGFYSESAYKSHVYKHEPDFGKYMCPICHVRYPSSRQKDAHYRKVHMFIYSCRSCVFECQNSFKARSHLKWHQGTNYNCQLCNMHFEDINVYLQHVRSQHGTEHVCVMCGLSYGTEAALGTHLQDSHSGDVHVSPEGPWCESCNIQFAGDEALEIHYKISPNHIQIVNQHESEDGYITKSRFINGRLVDDYPKWVKKKDLAKYEELPKLKRLRKTHYFDEPVACEQCGKDIYSSREYRSHFVREHPNMTRTFYPYLGKGGIMCDKCGKVFSCQAVLREHMLTHGEHSMYACSTCEKRFKTRTQLKNHVRVHDAPSHECPLCGLMFNHRGNRDRHYTHAHSDVKNYKCDHCDKRFKTNDERKLHTKHIHLKEPWPKRNRNRPLERQTINRSARNHEIEKQYYIINSTTVVEEESNSY